MQTRVALLEQIVQTNAATFARFDRQFEAQRAEIRALSAEQRADFRWLLGIMLGGFGALLGVLAHGFHWL